MTLTMTDLHWLKKKLPSSPSDFIPCSQARQSNGDRGLPGRIAIHGTFTVARQFVAGILQRRPQPVSAESEPCALL